MWRFRTVPEGWWASEANHRTFLQALLTARNLTLDDFYKMSPTIISSSGGRPLLRRWKSIVHIATNIFPEHNWQLWKFSGKMTRWWDSQATRAAYLSWLGERLGFCSLEDFYNLTTDHLVANHGDGLIRNSRYTVVTLLRSTWPAHVWEGWRFRHAPQGYWSDINTQRQFIESLRAKYNLTTMESLGQMTNQFLLDNDGVSLLAVYRFSILEMLRGIYTEHRWIPWRLRSVPQRFWTKPQHVLEFFEWFRQENNIPTLEGLYSVSTEALLAAGGGGMLQNYRWRTWNALKAAYPRHEWLPWNFRFQPRRLWDDPKVVKLFIDRIRQKLLVETMEDCYQLSPTILSASGGTGLVRRYKTMDKILSIAYPEHRPKWVAEKFATDRTPTENFLGQSFASLYPHLKLERQAPLSQGGVGKPWEVDWLAQVSDSSAIALEYQGEYHYFDMLTFGERKVFEESDAMKALQCGFQRKVLVEVPFWWDRSLQQLQLSIQKLSPELQNR